MKLLSKLLATALLLTVSAYTFAQSESTPSDTAIAQVDNFDQVKIQGPFEVYVTQGATQSVRLEAPTEVLKHIEAETSGSVLTVRLKADASWWIKNSFHNDPDNWWNHHRVIVRIAVKSVTSLSTSGSSNMYFSEGVSANNLKLHVSGSGKIEGRVTTQDLESSISGSGHISLTGSAQNSDVSISGSGNFNSSSLLTENSTVHISGSGRAEVNASEKIGGSMHGSSRIVYSGHPKSVSVSKSGSGSVSGS